MGNSVSNVRLIPLKNLVCNITGEADKNDELGIKKAVKGWHNKLANGSIPRSIIIKIGKGLFVDLNKFEQWLDQQ